MKQEKHYIYHITHLNNLPNIIQKEKLFPKNTIGNDYVNIAHQSVQDRRNRKVLLSPYGHLHDYVPFYFGMRSPMLFAIKNNKVQDYGEGQTPIIYLVSSVEWCQDHQLQFVFTDGHAAVELTTFYNDIKDLSQVDFDAAKARTWFDNHEYPDRKRQKQSEFLVKGQFPWQGIQGIVTINEEIKDGVTAIYAKSQSSHKLNIVIKPEWYY